MTPAVLLFVASLAPPVLLPARAQPPPPTTAALGEAYYLFLQGRALENDGDVEGAIKAYRRALELVPAAAEVHAELAGLHARQGRATEAMVEAELALKIDPDNREAHRILGFVQAALADRMGGGADASPLVTLAIGHLEQVLATGAPDPGALLTLGKLYLSARQFPKAAETLRAFVVSQPGYLDGQTLLAEAYRSNGNLGEAIEVLAGVVAQPEAPSRVHTMLAELYEQTGRWREAGAVWGDLAARSPRSLVYRSRQATALVNGGDLAAGREALLALTREAPRDVSAWYLLSQVERRSGHAADAEEAARRIAAIDASDARGPLALAGAQAARGDHAAVVATLEPRVTSPLAGDVANGTHARMAGELALAFEALDRRDAAVAVLEAARARAPGDDDLLFDLAATYERAGQLERAETTVRELLARDAQHAPALNYLGYMLADRGERLDEAVALIRRALVVDAGNPSYLDSLGWAYFRQGRHEDAREPLEQAARARPGRSVIQDHLGDLYVALKRYREAVTAFERALAGDRDGVDVAAVTKKRDRARTLAGR